MNLDSEEEILWLHSLSNKFLGTSVGLLTSLSRTQSMESKAERPKPTPYRDRSLVKLRTGRSGGCGEEAEGTSLTMGIFGLLCVSRAWTSLSDYLNLLPPLNSPITGQRE